MKITVELRAGEAAEITLPKAGDKVELIVSEGMIRHHGNIVMQEFDRMLNEGQPILRAANKSEIKDRTIRQTFEATGLEGSQVIKVDFLKDTGGFEVYMVGDSAQLRVNVQKIQKAEQE